jgi:hypothetical protein
MVTLSHNPRERQRAKRRMSRWDTEMCRGGEHPIAQSHGQDYDSIMSTILIIVVLVVLFGGGGGYYYSRRR